MAGLIAVLAKFCSYITLNFVGLTTAFTKVITSLIPSSVQGVGNESWMLGRVDKTLHYYSFQSVALWVPVLLAVLIMMFLDRYRVDKIQKQLLLVIALLASAAQLMIFAWNWLPAVSPEQFPLYPQNAITHFLQNDPTANRYVVWRDTTKDPSILPSNSSDIYRIDDFTGYESLTLPCMSVFYHKQIPNDSLDLHLLGLSNVKYIVTKSRVIRSADARLAFSADGVTIYENLLCKPRSYLAHRYMALHSDSAIGTNLLRKDFNGSVVLLAAQDVPANLSNLLNSNDSTRPDGDSIQITRSENEVIELSVDTRSKAMLTLTDTYYPGWKCYVNGQRCEIIRANEYMRAVEIEPGHSNVVFRFEPDIFVAGASTSAVTLLCTVGAILFMNLRNRKKTT